MLDKLLIWLIQSEESRLVAYILVDFIAHAIALYKEWIVLGKPYKALAAEVKTKTSLLETVQERLTEQRIINERSAATIEVLRDQLQELKLDVARLEGQGAAALRAQSAERPT